MGDAAGANLRVVRLWLAVTIAAVNLPGDGIIDQLHQAGCAGQLGGGNRHCGEGIDDDQGNQRDRSGQFSQFFRHDRALAELPRHGKAERRNWQAQSHVIVRWLADAGKAA